MTETSHFRRVLELCDQVLHLSDEERRNALDTACAGDTTLRASVDSVLVAIESAGPFLEPATTTGDAGTYVGRTVGPYRIIQHLAEGGMGSVYLAERQDADFSQRVAIKFVRGHLLARELVERFNAERKILAKLNHPYIAGLIDGGSLPDGSPYLVMEYVEGTPIDEYCDAHSRGVPDRIELIRKVAAAVQAAHQNLIVHRDLKPSNVLITPDGIPKLLDFGIAKLLQPEANQPSGNTTMFGRQAMTPDYASPEQILENRVTTASDVYTLGILTYQLLVGERPYHVPSTSHAEMVRAVDGLAVPRPSTRLDTLSSEHARQEVARRRGVTAQQLRRLLRGDLDNILMMALRAEPERRYASVAQFSDDLGRYLSGQPVMAREDTFSYRAVKFLQRNLIASSVAAVFAVSLVAGVIAYSGQAREAERQRDIAVSQQRQAQNTIDYLKGVLLAGDPFGGGEQEQTIGDVLQKAQETVRNSYADDPHTRGTILATLGDIYASRGDYPQAKSLADEAVSTFETEVGINNGEAANAYRIQGLALYYLDDYEAARQLFDKAIRLYLQQPAPDWSGLARAYDQLGMTLGYIEGEAAALVSYNKALSTYREQGLDDPPQLVAILNNIGTEHLQQGNYPEAYAVFAQAIEAAQRGAVSRAQQAALLANYAGALSNLGRLEEAADNYKRSAVILQEVIGPGHPKTILTLTSLAQLHQQMDQLDAAEAAVRQAIAGSATSLTPDQFLASYAQNVAGGILCRSGKVEEGTTLARQSLETRRELLPAGHWSISSGEGVLGACLAAAGQFLEAETLLTTAYEALRADRGAGHETTLGTRQRLYEMYSAWGKPDQARLYGPEAN